MDQMPMFSAILGLSPPWQVSMVTFAKESTRMDISIEYAHGSPLDCPVCGGKVTSCSAQTSSETWRHDDFLSYVTFLHAKVPLTVCCGGGTLTLERPWFRAGSRFSRVEAVTALSD